MEMKQKATTSAREKKDQSDFISLYDLLMSIDKHLSSIEGSVTVIRETAEDTNERLKRAKKVRELHGKVS